MHIIRISGLGHPGLEDYSKLTDVALRRVLEPAGGLYIAESTKVIARALAAGHRPRSILVQERWLPGLEPLLRDHGDIDVFVGDDAVLQQLTGYHLHRGALAAMHRPELLPVDDIIRDARRIVILEDIVDHTNVGAIFRSVAGLGADAVLITPRCADPLYRRAIRVSMGTVFQVPWTRIDPWPGGIELLKETGYVVAGMTLADDAITLDELVEQDHPRLALVFGTEGDGLSARTSAAVDVRVRIPMMGGVDSLNVAASSAVAFYATR